jgi:hypothetical protein
MFKKTKEIFKTIEQELEIRQYNKKIVQQCIQNISKINVLEKDIEIKNKKIILHTSSVVKKEILLYEKKILGELREKRLDFLKIL